MLAKGNTIYDGKRTSLAKNPQYIYIEHIGTRGSFSPCAGHVRNTCHVSMVYKGLRSHEGALVPAPVAPCKLDVPIPAAVMEQDRVNGPFLKLELAGYWTPYLFN